MGLPERLCKCAGRCLRVFVCIVPSHWRVVFAVGERGTIVPLLTSSASALWRASHAGAGMLHIVKLGGCSPPQGRGFRITNFLPHSWPRGGGWVQQRWGLLLSAERMVFEQISFKTYSLKICGKHSDLGYASALDITITLRRSAKCRTGGGGSVVLFFGMGVL